MEYQELKQQNAYHQWYKIKRAFDLLPNPNTYDYIIRIRPDLFILDSKEVFLSHLASLEPNILYVPDGFNIYDSKMNTEKRKYQRPICHWFSQYYETLYKSI